MMLEIREAIGDETELAARISHDVWHESQAPLQDPAIARYRTPLYFSDRIEELENPALLAFVDDHPAGMAAWRGNEVEQLYVLPHWRGLGVGRRLLQVCEELMSEAGAGPVRLFCICGNTLGRRFYESCNWRLIGLNPQSVESFHGSVNVLHWEFQKQLIPARPQLADLSLAATGT